ncbi:MAG: glycosyltransferase, partial [Ilumatobacteraceae bacterium]
MRVLISTWPAHGHQLPLLPIARAAVRAGHEVVIASGAEGVAEAQRCGFTTWDVGPSRAESDA